jgi:hypothetical protein
MNKKGVESFPFFLILTVLVGAFILIIGFYQVQTLGEFSAKKNAADSYSRLTNAMEDLKSTSDQGSFTRVSVKMPSGYSIIFANNGIDNDTITLKTKEEAITNTVEFDITATTFNGTLEDGNYEIVVYYGALTNESYQSYAIYFK